MQAVTRETFVSKPVEMGRVLIADDQRHVLDALEMLLGVSGFAIETVTNPRNVLPALETEQFDAVLMDLNYTRDTTGGSEGLELVSQIRSIDTVLPVVVMTAWSSVDLAVEAMRRGASDFVQKPWDNQELLQKLRGQVSSAKAQRRAQRMRAEELQEAREIQNGLLPKELPEIKGYEIAGTTQQLRFVGGDYYNAARISERHTALCIADVAGKGMPAALLMSSMQAALQPLISQDLAPRELCQRLNRILCDVTPVRKFISLFYGVLDNFDHRLTYCNAGHNPPLLIRADGTSAELGTTGAVLGQFPHWNYEQGNRQLERGDTLLLFTDGLVEACDAEENAFGEENVLRTARASEGSGAEGLMHTLLGASSRHCGGHFQDDASLMVLQRR